MVGDTVATIPTSSNVAALTFVQAGDGEPESTRGRAERSFMPGSSIASTSEYGALAALFQVTDERDCWCGESFAGVVEPFIAFPPNLDDPERMATADDPECSPTDDDRVRFPDLFAMLPLPATERRDRLVADIMALLERHPQEDRRREQIVLRDRKELLSFDDFWAEEGWSLDCDRLAGNLLAIAVAHATAWDPHAWDGFVACPTPAATPEEICAHDERRRAVLRARQTRAGEAFAALRER